MLKIIKYSVILSGFMLATSVLAGADASQAAIDNVQSQVQHLQDGLSLKLNALNKRENQQIAELEKSIQTQFDKMNKKIQKLEDSLNSKLNRVQKEVRQAR